ncbi:uncharacterized protein LAJ45_10815 [Morchella importuna]|uniref:uncharacterized protein n=1 Tax=Morchella importuna TaxID=1174673 RepID=UPI001E8E6F13|nr:uncharacterized protein LAJ45_10815 [Morchella importuna]KAH8145151.1 hypothetical protein LAJ45_10815 [Morchella importuna]
MKRDKSTDCRLSTPQQFASPHLGACTALRNQLSTARLRPLLLSFYPALLFVILNAYYCGNRTTTVVI